jgi:prepilin-type N-terminal cleavage/methylation domain-containing protein
MKPNRGFTLLEIMIAVLILSVSMIVLLGLQASVLTQEKRDSERQEAISMAKQILAAIELYPDPLKSGSQSANDLLKFLSPNSPAIKKSDLLSNLQIEKIGVPGLQNKDLERVKLTISWGNSDLDKVSFIYVRPDPGR